MPSGRPPLAPPAPLPHADQRLYPNPRCREPGHLAHYTFLGRLLGKALYEGILVEPTFAGFFLRKLLGHANTPDDLPSLDGELAASLRKLRHYDGARATADPAPPHLLTPPALRTGDFGDLALSFEASDEDARGGVEAVPLLPGGGAVAVTRENVASYVALMAHHRLSAQIAPQTRAFLR